MRKTFVFLVLSSLFFSISAFSQNEKYLLTSQDPDFMDEADKFIQMEYSSGRTKVVSLKIPFLKLPDSVKNFLRPVKSREIFNGAGGTGEKIAVKPEVLALLSKIDLSKTRNYMETMVFAGKRHSGGLDESASSGNRKSMDFIADFFASIGLEVERHCYKKRKEDKECNIIGRKKSSQSFSKSILIIGHMDSVGHMDAGADDNASGAAGVMEMARVLSAYKAEHNLLFVAANGEENGIAGTYALVKKMKETGELSNIEWVINMDMIAWNRDGIIELETNKEFKSQIDWVCDIALTYTNLKPYIAMPAWGSDHVPFLEAGIFSYLSIEHWSDHNPCYHKSCDKMDNLNLNYALEILKLNMAVIAHKTKLVSLP